MNDVHVHWSAGPTIALGAAAIVAMGLVAAPAVAATITVPGDAMTIQAALDAATNGDTILVSDGTYDGPGNRDLDFGGKLVTLTSVNGAALTTIDCEGQGRAFYFHTGETAAAVVSGFTIVNGYIAGGTGGAVLIESASPVFEYCEFVGNSVESAGLLTGNGGAVYADGGGPLFDHCIFIGNSANALNDDPDSGLGGAILFSAGSTGVVRDCEFYDNAATGPGIFGNGIGGAVFVSPSNDTIMPVEGPSNVSIEGSVFDGNSAAIAGGAIWLQGIVGGSTLPPSILSVTGSCFTNNSGQSGGAMAVFLVGIASVEDCDFTGNSVSSADPFVQQNIGGGAVGTVLFSSVAFRDCTFDGNVSTDGVGGGVATVSGSSQTFVNCSFVGNTAGTTGGGVQNGIIPLPGLDVPSSTSMTNCLVACNGAPMGGGIFNGDGSTLTAINPTIGHNYATMDGGGLANMGMGSTAMVTNGIFWGNESESGPSGSQILDGPGGVTVSYSIVKRGWPGTGNLSRSPRWVEADEDDCPDGNNYRLSHRSPAIDAGDDFPVTEPTDLDGNTRIEGAAVDMGAYEFQGKDDDDDGHGDDGSGDLFATGWR